MDRSKRHLDCRIELAQLLINEVRRKAPDRVKYHFQWSCEDVNLDNKSVTLGSPEGESVTVRHPDIFFTNVSLYPRSGDNCLAYAMGPMELL